VDDVEALWVRDYSQRTIIEGFLKDSSLGKKRLASMPDRITNTIHTRAGMYPPPRMYPPPHIGLNARPHHQYHSHACRHLCSSSHWLLCPMYPRHIRFYASCILLLTLASMPHVSSSSYSRAGNVVMRPTVINYYDGDMSTMAKWWEAWRKFIFRTQVTHVRQESQYISKRDPLYRQKRPILYSGGRHGASLYSGERLRCVTAGIRCLLPLAILNLNLNPKPKPKP
jgi:hypothetical protein